MSNKNYDVELPITYSDTYKHYIVTYKVAVPYYLYDPGQSAFSTAIYNASVSFDDGNETDLHYYEHWAPHYTPPVPFWNVDASAYSGGNKLVPDTGIFNKIYFRNPRRDKTTFTSSNCFVQPVYSSKAAFEIQWNSTGFAANSNAWFKCSTVPKILMDNMSGHLQRYIIKPQQMQTIHLLPEL